MDTYDFVNAQTDIRSIIQCISLHGEDLIGAEIGVYAGDSFLTILQNCGNIKKLYGVDNYQPYSDFLKENYDGKTPAYQVDKKTIEYVKLTAYHRLEYSGHQDKIVFYEMDSNDAAKQFPEEYLDFIFIDTYMTYEQAKNDMEVWYPKVKTGGIFAGHDWTCTAIQDAVLNFRTENNINSRMGTFDNTWIWYKNK